MEHVKGINRDQVILFPDTINEYISADNSVRFIDAFVDGLDLNDLRFEHAEIKETG